MSASTTALNGKTYGQLLRRTLPHVIHTEEEHARLAAELMRLDERENPTPEERELAELLTVLIEEYEDRCFPVRKASPKQVLQHLMEARNLTQKDCGRSLDRRELLQKCFTANVPSVRRRQKSWQPSFT